MKVVLDGFYNVTCDNGKGCISGFPKWDLERKMCLSNYLFAAVECKV